MTQGPASITTQGDIGRNLDSFRGAIAPPFNSANTAATNTESVRQIVKYLVKTAFVR